MSLTVDSVVLPQIHNITIFCKKAHVKLNLFTLKKRKSTEKAQNYFVLNKILKKD